MSFHFHPIPAAGNGGGVSVVAAYASFNPQHDKTWEFSGWLESVRTRALDYFPDLSEQVYLRMYLPQNVLSLYSKGGGVREMALRHLIPGNSRRHTRIAYFDWVTSDQIFDVEADFDQFIQFVQMNWPRLRSY